ncbi:MAG: hypothetical protein RL189_2299, partial [Pseudomonadota bacterium]
MTITFDHIIKGATVVRPHQPAPEQLDIGIKDGRFAALAPNLDPATAK